MHALASETPPRQTSPGLKLISLHTWDSDPIHLFHTLFLTCPPLRAVLEREEPPLGIPNLFPCRCFDLIAELNKILWLISFCE